MLLLRWKILTELYNDEFRKRLHFKSDQKQETSYNDRKLQENRSIYSEIKQNQEDFIYYINFIISLLQNKKNIEKKFMKNYYSPIFVHFSTVDINLFI